MEREMSGGVRAVQDAYDRSRFGAGTGPAPAAGIAQITERVRQAATHAANLAEQIHSQADRLYGPTPSEVAPGNGLKPTAVTTLIEELGSALTSLEAQHRRIEHGLARLASLG